MYSVNTEQKKSELAIFISDEVDFRAEYYQRQRSSFHNYKGILSGGHNNPKCLHTK